MVTIEIDGVKVEGETLKEAQRLARKEVARQKVAEKERDKKIELAQLHCYARIGHWAEFLETNMALPQALVPVCRGTSYSESMFRRHVTRNEDNDGDALRIESVDGNATWKCYGYTVTALIESAGFLIGAKIASTTNSGDAYYITTHAVDDVAAVAQVPKFIGEVLDKMLRERLQTLCEFNAKEAQ